MKTISSELELDEVIDNIFDYFYSEDAQKLSYYKRGSVENFTVRLSKKGFKLMEDKIKLKGIK